MSNTQSNENETPKTPAQGNPPHAPQQDQSNGKSGSEKPGEQPQQK
jgi:hypothetical protein